MTRPAIIVHGGAGRAVPESRVAHEEGVARASRRGWEVLQSGGSALDAVVAAVADLEDDPHFNAGLGSTLTSAGTVEMDASVMDGARLAAGAVGAVADIRNPVHAARAVLDRSPHILLAGDAARQCAATWGIELCEPEALITERQRARWHQRVETGSGNTVGAVAVDAEGHVAAATSTGGIFFKAPGRIGDSAIIGAGTYADDCAGAASATGMGEAIITMGLAKMATDSLRDGIAPQRAAERAIAELARRTKAEAGVIVIDPFGRIGHAYNTEHMPVACMPETAVSYWCLQRK